MTQEYVEVKSYKRKLQDLETKLLKKIRKENGCWIWIGSVFKKPSGSYGQIRIGRHGQDKLYRSHRVSYEHFKGKIPIGMELDHLCKNTLCINPDHLEAVSHLINMGRAKHATKTHCIHGHEYTKQTLYINTRGARECKICRGMKIESVEKNSM